MSEKVAHTLSQVVARNVAFWRNKRGLDQQGLADRVGALGWLADRTTITRIEKGGRKVTVDDLGILAVALNVPLPLLLLPVHSRDEVSLTPATPTVSVNRWYLWSWMLGEHPLPGRHGGLRVTEESFQFVETEFGDEWRTGSEPLWLYERVVQAQRDLQRLDRSSLDGIDQTYRNALQALVDAVADMHEAGLPAEDLVHESYETAIRQQGIRRSERGGRFASLEDVDSVRKEVS